MESNKKEGKGFSRNAHDFLDGKPGIYKLSAHGHGIKVAVKDGNTEEPVAKLLTVVKFGGKGKENTVLFNGHYDKDDPTGSKKRDVRISFRRLRGMGSPLLPAEAENGHGEIVNLATTVIHGAAEAQSWAEAEGK